MRKRSSSIFGILTRDVSPISVLPEPRRAKFYKQYSNATPMLKRSQTKSLAKFSTTLRATVQEEKQYGLLSHDGTIMRFIKVKSKVHKPSTENKNLSLFS